MNQSRSRNGRLQLVLLVLVVAGCALPLNYFVRFLLSEGLNVSLFFQQLFHNNISSFFAMDVLVSTLTVWLFVFVEGRRLKMKMLWIYVACTMIVGVSLALPMFLLIRSRSTDSTD